jgi:thiamine-phosphate pyrophosphorylase
MLPVDFRLYLVTDRHQTKGRSLGELLARALRAGVSAIQLRERDVETRDLLSLAQEMQGLSQRHGAKLFVNDRLDVGEAVGAAGVHLRADSLPVPVARRLLGTTRWIGVSTHSVQDVMQAEQEGADFAVLGPIYDTPSKRQYGNPLGLGVLKEASHRCRIPIFAIGGITSARVRDLRQAGAFGVAVTSSILSKDDVEAATRSLLDSIAATV